MQFKDAAYEILKEAGKPLHYNEITDLAQQKGILDTAGQTPHATMGALLYTDTIKENYRFRRSDEKGTFALAVTGPKGIKQQIESIQNNSGIQALGALIFHILRCSVSCSRFCWSLLSVSPGQFVTGQSIQVV